MVQRYTLKKTERLNSKKDIDRLFTSGARSILAFPVRAVYKIYPAGDNDENRVDENAVLVSVSKRFFKHSVDRNLVKRQIREAYRTNKSILEGLPASAGRIHIAFLWTDSRLRMSKEVNSKVKNLLTRIVEAFSEIK